MHPTIQRVRYYVERPLHNYERIAPYRSKLDETSEFHRAREAAGIALKQRLAKRWSKQ